MDGARADLVFTDPPYNVAIDGNVCGLGSVKHREFAFASGEMSQAQFTGFLSETLGNISQVMRDGAIAYVCMDWRHMPHPDDVVIDVRRAEVRQEGPLDEREKAQHDKMIARRDAAQAEVNNYAARYRRAKSEAEKALWLREWHFEQRMFDLINDSMSGRDKLDLENRSYRDGATQEGKTLQAYIEDRRGKRSE